MTIATTLNGKRATVRPDEAQRWAAAANGNGHHEDADDFEAAESNGTPPVPETTNGRGKSTQRGKGAPATAAVESDKPQRDSSIAADVRKIPLAALEQHPANPDPSEQEIMETVAWLAAGQLEPIIVRPDEYADGRIYFQVLAGKRRCIAAARLGWEEIECRVRRDLHEEAAALAVMAATNAQRHVETPIRQALMLKAMIDAGMTHEAAGKIYGLESKSGVVNKLRLLQLPAVWHERLASAEISERAARQLVPYVACERVMQAIDKAWRSDQKASWLRDRWDAGGNLSRTLDRIVAQNVRPIDKKQKHNYGWELGNHARQFELTPEVEATLDIVELPLGKNGAAVKVATNAAAYDKLQLPILKAKAKAKSRATQKPKKSDSSQPLTPAALKAKRKEQDAQTAKRVATWRHRFLRFAASGCVQAGDWRTGLLAPWLLQATGRGGYGNAPINEFLHDALVMMNQTNARGRTWGSAGERYGDELIFSHVITAVDADGDPVREVEELQMLLCGWLLWPATNVSELQEKLQVVSTTGEAGERLPPLDDEDVEAICTFLGVDLAMAWNNLAHANAFGKHFVREFFELHTKDQLAALVEELKIDDLSCKSKEDLVDAFCGSHNSKNPLRLPQAIAPITAAGKPKKGRRR